MNNASNLAAISLVPSIVRPVLCSVNHSAGSNGVIRADGWPLPPLPPRNTEPLFADGWPLPPLPPRNIEPLFADGWPLPPLPPGRHILAAV